MLLLCCARFYQLPFCCALAPMGTYDTILVKRTCDRITRVMDERKRPMPRQHREFIDTRFNFSFMHFLAFIREGLCVAARSWVSKLFEKFHPFRFLGLFFKISFIALAFCL